MILYSSEPKGVCFVESKNLDGETNLKQKMAHFDVYKQYRSDKNKEEVLEDDIARKHFEYCFESPNPYLYTFNGYL
jgi:phospholipid-transporting ATPase